MKNEFSITLLESDTPVLSEKLRAFE